MVARRSRDAGRAAVQPDTFDTAAEEGELKVSRLGVLVLMEEMSYEVH